MKLKWNSTIELQPIELNEKGAEITEEIHSRCAMMQQRDNKLWPKQWTRFSKSNSICRKGRDCRDEGKEWKVSWGSRTRSD